MTYLGKKKYNTYLSPALINPDFKVLKLKTELILTSVTLF